jgi:hypothetical protein
MPAISTLAGNVGYGRAGRAASTTIVPYTQVGDTNAGASMWVVKYTTDGGILWRANIGGVGTTSSVIIPTGQCASDSAGNIYVGGILSQPSATFYNSDDTIAFTVTNEGSSSTFLAKYNNQGFVQWATSLTASSGASFVTSVAVDTSGNILVGGTFGGNCVFIDTSNIPFRQFTSVSTNDAFVAKLDTFGLFQWVSVLSGDRANDYVTSIVTDPSGNVYALATWQNISPLTTFNGVTANGVLTQFGSALPNVSSSISGWNNAIIKYNSSGTILWRSRFGSASASSSSATNIVANSTFTNFYVSFSYNGSILVYDATNTLIFSGATSNGIDSALVNYNADGTPIWFARNYSSSTGADYAVQNVVDNQDNVYVLAQQGGTTSSLYNAGEGPSFVLDSASFASGIPAGTLVIKYNSGGQGQWFGRFTSVTPIGLFSDTNGNVYVTLQNTAQFVYTAPNSITTNGPLFYGGTHDMVLVKLDSNGNFVWFTRIVSSAGSEMPMRIASDSLGNMIVMGNTTAISYTKSTLLYNADASLFTQLPPALSNSTDVFVARYTTLGVGSWAANIGSFVGTNTSRFTACSSSGDVYVTGQYSSNPLHIFGSTIGDKIRIDNIAIALDIFIAKYNSIGKTIWAVRIAINTSVKRQSNIRLDSNGNVYIALYYSGSIAAFGTDDVNFSVSSTNPENILIKYNSDGVIQWYYRVSHSTSVAGIYTPAIAIDSSDNVILTGAYFGNATFTNSDNSKFGTTLSALGGLDVFLAKITSQGITSWITRFGGTSGNEIGTQIDVDSIGNVYVSGQMTQTISIYNATSPNSGIVATLPLQSGSDVFVLKYDPDGIYQWAYRFGGTGVETATGITVDNAGNSYLIATYTVAATTFPSPSFSIPAPSATDIVVIKYDTSGSPVWFIRVSGAGNEAAGNIACNKITGDIYFVGQMGTSGVSFIDASGNTAKVLTPESANNDGFIASYDIDGTFVWATRIGSTTTENITGIDIDTTTNTLAVTGTYTLNGVWACSVGY